MVPEVFRIFLKNAVLNVYKFSNHSEGVMFLSAKCYGMPHVFLNITVRLIFEIKMSTP